MRMPPTRLRVALTEALAEENRVTASWATGGRPGSPASTSWKYTWPAGDRLNELISPWTQTSSGKHTSSAVWMAFVRSLTR